MAYEFTLTRRVEFSETDMAGIVHFANFFRFMEECEHAFFRSFGMSVVGEPGGVSWPRVAVSCDFRQPLRFEDEVTTQLLVATVGSKSIRYVFVIRRGAEEVARGQVTVACVQKVNGQMRAVEIPADVRAKITVAPAELLPKEN